MDRVQQDFASGKVDAATRVTIEQRIDHKRAVGEQMKNDGDKAAMGAAQEWILKNTGKSVLEMPPNLYAWAKSSGHLSELDKFASREGRPGERMKELEARGRLMNQAATDPDAFIETFKKNAFADQFDLGATGIKEMQNIASNMMQGTGKYKIGFDEKIMRDAIPPALLSSGAKEKRNAFEGLQHEAMIQWRKDNPGKQPTLDEQKAVARAANAEFVVVNRFVNDNVKAFEIKEGKDNAVPADFFKAMKAKGAKDDEILSAWKLKQSMKKAR